MEDSFVDIPFYMQFPTMELLVSLEVLSVSQFYCRALDPKSERDSHSASVLILY